MSWKKINNNNLKVATRSNEFTDFNLFKEFINNNYIITYKSAKWYGTTLHRFMENYGRIAGRVFIDVKKLIPNIDHEHVYRNVHGDIFIVSHTYAEKDDILESFNKWNDGFFKIEIYAKEKSWYYPNNTTLFIITKKDVKVNL